MYKILLILRNRNDIDHIVSAIYTYLKGNHGPVDNIITNTSEYTQDYELQFLKQSGSSVRLKNL